MSREMALNGGSDSATIAFAATAQMAPRSRLVVYAIRSSSNEILVDAVDFKVNGLFRNEVSETWAIKNGILYDSVLKYANNFDFKNS